MKKKLVAFLFCTFLCTLSLAQKPDGWYDDIDEVIEQSLIQNKPILIDFYNLDNLPSIRVRRDEELYSQNRVKDIFEKYILLYVDITDTENNGIISLASFNVTELTYLVAQDSVVLGNLPRYFEEDKDLDIYLKSLEQEHERIQILRAKQFGLKFWLDQMEKFEKKQAQIFNRLVEEEGLNYLKDLFPLHDDELMRVLKYLEVIYQKLVDDYSLDIDPERNAQIRRDWFFTVHIISFCQNEIAISLEGYNTNAHIARNPNEENIDRIIDNYVLRALIINNNIVNYLCQKDDIPNSDKLGSFVLNTIIDRLGSSSFLEPEIEKESKSESEAK